MNKPDSGFQHHDGVVKRCPSVRVDRIEPSFKAGASTGQKKRRSLQIWWTKHPAWKVYIWTGCRPAAKDHKNIGTAWVEDHNWGKAESHEQVHRHHYMNPSDGTYRHYLVKPNSTPMYVNVKSNHQPQVIKKALLGINRRIPCNEQAFNDAKSVHQDTLEASGHPATSQFAESNTASTVTRCNRKRKQGRKIICFTPTSGQSVQTNIGKKFLSLINN